MSHVALYRKYRSQTFEELVGQEHVIKTLRHAIDRGSIHHAFLFTGPRGTGKTSTARLMAKALNCVNGPTGSPCGACHICTSIATGSCIDVIEMDAASEAGVDDVREKIVDVVQYRPTLCRYKVFIIDEVHDLSSKAFDALLKTIEEPPGHIVFVLATTELHAVPPTIQSRCQKFTFHRANLSQISERLEFVLKSEGQAYELPAIHRLARLADGGFRDALSLLEQMLATAPEVLTLDLVTSQLGLFNDDMVDQLALAIHHGKVTEILELVDEAYRMGRDAQGMVEALLERLAELTRASFDLRDPHRADAPAEARLSGVANKFGQEGLLRLRDACARWLKDVRDVSLPKLWIESAFLGYAVAPPPASSPVPVQQPSPVTSPAAAVPEPQPRAEAKPAVREAPKRPAATSEEAAAWNAAVQAVSQLSRAAAIRLEGSHFSKRDGDTIVINFARVTDTDWVREKQGLMPKIQEEFSKHLPGKWSFQLVAENGPVTQEPHATAVELPAQGQELYTILKKEFEDF